MRALLFIGAFCRSDPFELSLAQLLDEGHYVLRAFKSFDAFLNFAIAEHQRLDCLILEDNPDSCAIAQLQAQAILLPTVILQVDSNSSLFEQSIVGEGHPSHHYQVVKRYDSALQLEQLHDWIEQAINQFLRVSPDSQVWGRTKTEVSLDEHASHAQILSQQQRLAERLKERLGYLGVYYKRNPEQFLRYLPQPQRQDFLEHLKVEYRRIILSYFAKTETLNQQIDHFVNLAFFADVSVPKIVELHMELMDEFAKQLKLEGRSEEILLDYRLALIDVIAHLCEMYRRSIPRES